MKKVKCNKVFLSLGEEYYVWPNSKPRFKTRVKFIQTTNHGFNMLNVNTNKCILKNHLYITKKIHTWDKRLNGCWFFIYGFHVKRTNNF